MQVLIVGLNGVGAEIAKNVILTGVDEVFLLCANVVTLCSPAGHVLRCRGSFTTRPRLAILFEQRGRGC